MKLIKICLSQEVEVEVAEREEELFITGVIASIFGIGFQKCLHQFNFYKLAIVDCYFVEIDEGVNYEWTCICIPIGTPLSGFFIHLLPLSGYPLCWKV